MNKKNNTLLIALSILVITIIAILHAFDMKNAKTADMDTTSSSEEVVEEQPRVEEVKQEVIEEKAETVTLLSIEEIAKEVLAGKWGNGEERKNKLTEAGYDYEDIQKEVDKITPKPAPAPKANTQKSVSKPTPVPQGKYPEARLIWNTLRSWGWTPETCAGIIGNMMAEVGGCTLNLSNWNCGGCGYGLIQWTSGRAALIKRLYGATPNIAQQLLFIKDELFGTNGVRQQVNNSALNVIMNNDGKQTPESVAMCFATYYERCSPAYRARRQGFARTAYNYFMQ